MVSLWGSKKDEDPEARRPVSAGQPSEPHLSEADERTHLLPPPTAGGREGFLSPDDPAVSHHSLRIQWPSIVYLN